MCVVNLRIEIGEERLPTPSRAAFFARSDPQPLGRLVGRLAANGVSNILTGAISVSVIHFRVPSAWSSATQWSSTMQWRTDRQSDSIATPNGISSDDALAHTQRALPTDLGPDVCERCHCSTTHQRIRIVDVRQDEGLDRLRVT